MMDQITPIYILHLLLGSGVLFLLFYSYSKLVGRSLPFFNSIAGGFITFLAVNELIAVPFTLLHLKFSHFLLLFVLVNLSVLLFGLKHIFKNKKLSVDKRLLKTPYVVLSIAILITSIALAQVNAYHSADDSFYVSLVEQNKNSELLYSTDPASGNVDHKFPRSYRFQGWELTESASSEALGLKTTEFVQGLTPIVMLIVVFLAFKNIFAEFLKKNDKYLALSLLFTMFLFGAYSPRSPGAFLMTRPWQGKTILVSLIIPILTFLLYKIYKSLDKKLDKRLIAALFVLNLASISLNPSSVFINLSLIAAFGLMFLYKSRRISTAAALLVSALPFLPIIVFTLFSSESRGEARLEIKSFVDYLTNFLGQPTFFLIWAVGSLLFFKNKIMEKVRVINYTLPIVLGLSVLNPLLQPFISDQITSTAYWRLFWLVPIYISVPLIGVIIKNYLTRKYRPSKKYQRNIVHVIIVAVLLLTFALSGRYVYDTTLPVSEFNTTRHKAPAGVYSLMQFLETQPEGTVLAANYPATHLHNFMDKHVVLAPRTLNVRVNHEKDSDDFIIRMQLIAIMNKEGDDYFTTERYHQELVKFGVNYVVYDNDNIFLNRYTRDYKTESLFQNEQYSVFKFIP